MQNPSPISRLRAKVLITRRGSMGWMMCSIREIAEAHGMSQSAVKMSLMRTRKKLEKFLRKEELL